MNFTILRFDTLDSTNTEAAKHAKLGASEGLCIIARHQTAGRGRHGRKWISNSDSGLYFSVVLRPKLATRFMPMITLMTGVAAHDTLGEFGLKPDIKWVNDLLVGEKKIGGILAEAVETNEGVAIVVGIGINLKSFRFSPDIAATATSIEEETGRTVTSDELAEKLTEFISYFYSILNGKNGPAKIIDQWRRRSSYFTGKDVRVVLENESIIGTTDGLEENGALRVRKRDGGIAVVQAGNVQNIRPTI